MALNMKQNDAIRRRRWKDDVLQCPNESIYRLLTLVHRDQDLAAMLNIRHCLCSRRRQTERKKERKKEGKRGNAL